MRTPKSKHRLHKSKAGTFINLKELFIANTNIPHEISKPILSLLQRKNFLYNITDTFLSSLSSAIGALIIR